MFEEIIGNKQIKERLQKSLELNKISHSYMFVGIEGIGKKILATKFAKAILCIENEESQAEKTSGCNKCKSCKEFNTNNNPDFLIIEPEGNSIKIEQIRYLQKKVQEKPIISNKKVYIIDNADLMTKEAQNCLLKTLEEPPEFATIILIGSNENSFLNTIKSRCMIIRFNPISNQEIEKYLEQNKKIDQISEEILNLAEGSIGKASKIIEKQSEYKELEKIILNLEKQDIIEIIKNSQILYSSKEEIFELLNYINIILLKISKQTFKYTGCIKIVENTKKRINQNANYDMSIDYMLFKMWEEVN